MQQFLREHYPNDVLMPVWKGQKHPMFRHRSGEWSWDSFNHYSDGVRRSEYDVCVLLHDLCVIDVDCLELADELERKFPVLRDVPCETTRRGRHYWFRRPAFADDMGFFDGAAQKEAGIDFKTVCASGTSGVVLVAPSTDKTWLRPLWTTPVIDAPLDLLRAVANPRQVGDRRLVFIQDDPVPRRVSCKWLRRMSYFDAFLDEEGDFAEADVPVPCKLSDFQDLVDALDSKAIIASSSRAGLQHLVGIADLLGLDRRSMTYLFDTGALRRQLHTAETCMRWWYANYAESCEPFQLVDALRFDLTYQSIQRDDSFLFHKLRTCGAKEGDHVIRRLHEIDAAPVPRVVLDLMQRYPGKVVLAGGAVVGMLGRFAEPGKDFDLFVTGLTAGEAERVVHDAQCSAGVRQVHQSSNAVTLLTAEGAIVQIIFRLYDLPGQVLASFDLAPAKVLAVWHQESERLVFLALPSWIEAMRHMAYPLDVGQWTRATVARVIKYHVKGFEVFVPGLVRSALKPTAASADSPDDASFTRLLTIERRLLTSGCRILGRVGPRVSLKEYWRAVRTLHCSDYDVMAKLQHRLVYLLRALLRRVWPSLPPPPPPMVWRRFDQLAARQGYGVTDLTPAKFNKCFKLAEWQAALSVRASNSHV